MAPVIPASVSERMFEIYQLGQSLGNNPHAFSKVGDCQTMLPDFFGDFDNGKYNLGEYSYLQPTVDYFSGSFGRISRGVKNGLTASGVMATLWNSWKDCNLQETPLECEYRINNPSIAIISLGTNDANGTLPFEDMLRRVIDVTIEHGIVPILATKADNAEGDWSINATIVRLAYEYQIPVWNFWLAVQALPQHGLRSPEHLTYGEYTPSADFSKTENMQYGYNVRNLTALQVLDTVWRAMTGQPAPAFVPTPITYLP
jgi:lysophospholipase L1-like esterase